MRKREEKTYTRAKAAVACANLFDLWTCECVLYSLTMTASCIEFLSFGDFWSVGWGQGEGFVDWVHVHSIGCADFEIVDVERTVFERVYLRVC
jgi:hypothetical protein